jgi:hypothetical protein
VRRDGRGVHVSADFASSDFDGLLPIEQNLWDIAPQPGESLLSSSVQRRAARGRRNKSWAGTQGCEL